MFGRFPLYTDEDVDGDLVQLLRRRGWDLVRAVERFPQGTPDPIHFEQAAKEGRVLITNDQPSLNTAHRWLRERRAQGPPDLAQETLCSDSIGEIASKIEAITQEEGEPFAYPIRYIRPG